MNRDLFQNTRPVLERRVSTSPRPFGHERNIAACIAVRRIIVLLGTALILANIASASRLYVGDYLGTVSAFDSVSGTLVQTYSATTCRVGRLAVRAGTLYLANGCTQAIDAIDIATGSPLGTFVAAGSGGLIVPGGFVFGPDGDLYVVN